MRIKTKGLKETNEVAQSFITDIASHHKGKGAFVVGLYGNLGSGKTAFVKEVGRILGITDTIISPTFILERIYKISEGHLLKDTFEHVVHVDAYRFTEESELLHLGWKEIIQDPKNFVFVEWPNLVEGLLPKDTFKINFTFVDDNTREISWQE